MTGALGALFRGRSALELAVLVAYLVRALSGWVVALPLVAVIASSGLGALPQGDRALFEPGGLWLLETLQKQAPALGASARTELVLFALAAAVGIAPHALLFAAAAEPGTRFPAVLTRALRALPRFALVFLLECGVAALWLFASAIGAGFVSEAAPASLAEPYRDLPALAMFALGVAGAAVTGVIFDLTRAASARDATLRVVPALEAGVLGLKRSPWPLAGGTLIFAGAGALLVALSARAVEWLDVGKPGALRVLAVFVLHQASLLGLSVLQALWVRRVTTVLPAPETIRRDSARRAADDRSEHSAARDDPSPDPGA